MRLILILCIGAVILIPSVVGTFLLGLGGGFFLGLLGVLLSFPLWVLLFFWEAIYRVRQDKVELEAAKARVAKEEEEMEAYLLAQMSNRATVTVASPRNMVTEETEKNIEMGGNQGISQEWQGEKQEETMFSTSGFGNSSSMDSGVEGAVFTEPSLEGEVVLDSPSGGGVSGEDV